jgi:uncharacterized membrane protein
MTTVASPVSMTADGSAVTKVVPAARRLDSIDLVRGLVIVIMALDHVRGNFTNPPFDPANVALTTAPYFLTRWITHFCAPTFVFLAGTGAYLYGARGRTKGQLAWFLFSRGLWLVLLEVTVVRYSWFLNLTYTMTVGQVIWAIGWSMVVLSGLVFLPTAAVTAFGVAMIVFHNLFDGVQPEAWDKLSWLWSILHTGEAFEWIQGKAFGPFYPLIPWIGVMAAGYGFGALMRLEPSRRRTELIGLGLALILLFVGLRYSNLYGDKPIQSVGTAGPWSVHYEAPPNNGAAFGVTRKEGDERSIHLPAGEPEQKSWLFTLFSFVNCQKYPPSLVFLLMTLGPAILAIGLFERPTGAMGRFFVIFGRVPLFFYLIHWYVIKGLVIALAYYRYGRFDWLYSDPPNNAAPADWGIPLWQAYLVWAGVVLFLFPLCYWFAGVKRRSQAAWLSYL